MPARRRVTVMIDLDCGRAHHVQMFAGIQRYARECGQWECSSNPFAADLLTDGRRQAAPDGIVGRATPALEECARATGTPVVNVWLNSLSIGLPTVVHDAKESGRMAAQHLLAHGFRRFGYLGFLRDRTARLQLSGFREILRAADCDCSTCWVSRNLSSNVAQWVRFQAALDERIDTWSPPVAVVSTTDLLSRYLAEACHRRGIAAPSGVGLLGSSNESMICQTPAPSLSSIDLGYDHVGYR